LSGGLASLGRYRLGEILGQGGMALVYRARDGELDRPVAIKLLADDLAPDEALRRRFLREARLAARLAHPNVVQVYDLGAVDGRPYIVMEYVEGETLAEVLERRGRIPAREAAGLALQVCAGLQHAHEAGLVHRDVKPQNILVSADGTLKIADFGIARSAQGTRLTEIGDVLGTAAYLAPEQAAGEEVTAAADIYALGVVFYELLTGRRPYTVETLTQLLLRQQEQPVIPVGELAPDVPPALEDIVMRCLARIPDYRPASAAALADQLAAALSELPTRPLQRASVATEEAPTRIAWPRRVLPRTKLYETAMRDRSRSGRRVWRAAAILVVSVVLALIAVSSLGGSDRPSRPSPAAPPAVKSPAAQARDFAAWLRQNSN
jgi:eukaryotic-like serine/threonine-protein kinase